MNTEIIKVDLIEKQVLHNIMQFYIYEFSAFINAIKLCDNGLYDPFELDDYWTNANKYPFFIKVDGVLAGFVLVHSETNISPNSIAEFFVMKKYSGKGIGKAAAREIFDMFPGKWRVTQIPKNYPAQAFWRSVIADYTNGNYSERYDEKRKSVQEFDTSISQ